MKIFEIFFILLILLPIALIMRFFVSKLSAEKPMQRRSAEEDMTWGNPLKGGLGRKKRRKPKPSQDEAEEEPGQRGQSRNASQDTGSASRRKKTSTGKKSSAKEAAGRPQEPAGRRNEPYRDPDPPRQTDYYTQQSRMTGYAYDRSAVRPAPEIDVTKGRPSGVYDPAANAGNSGAASKGRRLAELKRTQRIPFSELYGKLDESAGGSSGPGPAESSGSVSASVTQRVSERRAAAKNAPRSEQEPSKRQKRRNRERARKRELARRDKDNKES